MTFRPSRAALTAAVIPAGVPPATHTSQISMISIFCVDSVTFIHISVGAVGNRTYEIEKIPARFGNRTYEIEKIPVRFGNRTYEIEKMPVRFGNRTYHSVLMNIDFTTKIRVVENLAGFSTCQG